MKGSCRQDGGGVLPGVWPDGVDAAQQCLPPRAPPPPQGSRAGVPHAPDTAGGRSVLGARTGRASVGLACYCERTSECRGEKSFDLFESLNGECGDPRLAGFIPTVESVRLVVAESPG